MNLFTLFGRIAIDDKGATSKIDSVTNTARRSEGIIGSSFSKIGKAIAAAFTVKSIVGFEKKIISTYATYDDQMRKVAAVSGATGKAYDDLRNKAEELGRTTRFSALEAGEGMEALARAGWKTSDIINETGNVLNFASANSIELGDAAELVSDGLNQFGLSAKDTQYFTDVLSQTAASSSTDVMGLKESLENTSGMVKTFGYDLEDISVALGTMGDESIKGGKAGTQLNSAFMNMAKGGKDVNAAMKDLGISLFDAQGNAKPLNEVLGDLRGAFANLTDEQKAQYASTLFGQTGMKGMMSVIEASDEKFNDLTDAIANSTGKTKEMQETMDGGLGGAIASVSSAWEGLLIHLGKMQDGIAVDALNKLADVLQKMPDKIDRLNEKWQSLKTFIKENETVIKAIGVAFAVMATGFVGNSLIAEGGIFKLGASFAKLMGKTKILGPAMSGVGKAFTFLKDPTGIATIAIAAFAAGAYLVYKNWDKISKWLKETFEKIGNFTSKIWGGIKDFFKDLWEDIKDIFHASVEGIGNFFKEAWQAITDFFIGAWQVVTWPFRFTWELIKSIVFSAMSIIEAIIGTILNVIKAIWEGIWYSIGGFVMMIWEWITNIIITFTNIVRTVITTITIAIKTTIVIVWTTIKDFILTVWTAIVEFTAPIWQRMLTVIYTIITTIKTIVSTVTNAIKTVVVAAWNFIKVRTQAIWNTIKIIITTVWNVIKRIVTTSVNVIKNIITKVWNTIKNVTSTIWNGIKNIISTAINGAKSVVTSVVNSIKSVVTSVWNTIKSTTTRIWNGVKEAMIKPVNAAKETIRKAVEAIKGFFEKLKIKPIKIPKPKVPKFSISGGFSLTPPKVPKINVAWNKEGAIFTKPTIFNTPQGFQGVGEAGHEAVLPIEKLSSIFVDTLKELGLGGPIVINIDGREVFRAMSPHMAMATKGRR